MSDEKSVPQYAPRMINVKPEKIEAEPEAFTPLYRPTVGIFTYRPRCFMSSEVPTEAQNLESLSRKLS